jgi:hypothetical protein
MRCGSAVPAINGSKTIKTSAVARMARRGAMASRGAEQRIYSKASEP